MPKLDCEVVGFRREPARGRAGRREKGARRGDGGAPMLAAKPKRSKKRCCAAKQDGTEIVPGSEGSSRKRLDLRFAGAQGGARTARDAKRLWQRQAAATRR
ncbi:hypothetical protein [Burkholderia multivorans]|uniref:hypothetical protein n=1 Tax=Burkholderia multivorans TaxID=87883 RepID=UPI003BB02CBB